MILGVVGQARNAHQSLFVGSDRRADDGRGTSERLADGTHFHFQPERVAGIGIAHHATEHDSGLSAHTAGRHGGH